MVPAVSGSGPVIGGAVVRGTRGVPGAAADVAAVGVAGVDGVVPEGAVETGSVAGEAGGAAVVAGTGGVSES